MTKNEIREQVNRMMKAPSCCAEAKGGKYCICDACQAGGALLEAEADLLA